MSIKDDILELKIELNKLRSIVENKDRMIKNLLVKVKNGDFIPDRVIYNGSKYNELSSSLFKKICHDQSRTYLVINISSSHQDENFINIQPEQCEELDFLVPNKNIPLFIICDDGTKSIICAEQLFHQGYNNISIVAGGHKAINKFKSLGLKAA